MLFSVEASTTRPTRLCDLCGLAVGTYEPAVFVFAHEIIRSSRAASPGLATKPGCHLNHTACFEEHARAHRVAEPR